MSFRRSVGWRTHETKRNINFLVNTKVERYCLTESISINIQLKSWDGHDAMELLHNRESVAPRLRPEKLVQLITWVGTCSRDGRATTLYNFTFVHVVIITLTIHINIQRYMFNVDFSEFIQTQCHPPLIHTSNRTQNFALNPSLPCILQIN